MIGKGGGALRDTSVFQAEVVLIEAVLLGLISNPHNLTGTKVKLWSDSQSALQSIFSHKSTSQSAGGRHHRTVSVSKTLAPNRTGLGSRTLR